MYIWQFSFPGVLSKDRPASFPGWGVIFLSRSELFIRFIHLSYNTYLIFISSSELSSNCPTGFTATIVQPILTESCCRIFEINTFHFSYTCKTRKKWNIFELQNGFCTEWDITLCTAEGGNVFLVPHIVDIWPFLCQNLFGLFRIYQLSSDAQNRCRHLLNMKCTFTQWAFNNNFQTEFCPSLKGRNRRKFSGNPWMDFTIFHVSGQWSFTVLKLFVAHFSSENWNVTGFRSHKHDTKYDVLVIYVPSDLLIISW